MIANIPLNRIDPNPWQTRQSLDPEYVAGLADDIQINGLLQTPTGRLVNAAKLTMGQDPAEILAVDSDVRVQLAFGHNRLAAYKLIRERKQSVIDICMPVNIRDLSDEQMADFAWSENEKRRDVGPLERAKAIRQRLTDFGWTQDQAARHLGISRSAVANILRILNLPEDALQALESGQISERIATALVTYQDRYEQISGLSSTTATPGQMLRGAMNHNWTSDYIRQRADELIEYHTHDMARANWSLDDELAYDDSRSPICRDCEARVKHTNRCYDRDCYEARGNAWRSQQLTVLVARTGIPALEDDRYDYSDTTNIDDDTILASGCENLRLKWEGTKWHSRNALLDADGNLTGAVHVCCKPSHLCKCIKGLKYAKAEGQVTDSVNAEELEKLASDARRAKKEARQEIDHLVERAGARISAGLVTHNRKTWRELAHKLSWSLPDKIPADADPGIIADAIGKWMAVNALPDDPESIRSAIRLLNSLLATCGVEKLPEPPVEIPVGKTLAVVFAEENVEA